MPIIDIIFGVSSVFLIAETLEDNPDMARSETVLMFTYPVGTFGSAIQGFRRINACKKFMATPLAPDTTSGNPQQKPLSLDQIKTKSPAKRSAVIIGATITA